jgi:HK97 family phage major capsid protein
MDEGSSISQSAPTLSSITLTARKWGAYTEVTSEAIDDSLLPLAELIMDDMVTAHANAVDDAGFNGDGSASYNSITGILNALGSAAIKSGSGNSWSALTLEDHQAVAAALNQKAFDNANQNLKWYCSSQYFWSVMVKLMMNANGVTASEIQGMRRPVFMGYPVEFAQVMPTSSSASQIPVVLGNLRQGAAFGDRRQFRLLQSPHFKADADVVAMLSTRRYDIHIHGAGDASNAEVIAALQTTA